ncbi:MAG: hypothetical protein JST04_15335 [Bdellovibrionales bacterium]|nr:hypothetical protein [Bdellovibrionales bacterium]
MKSLLLISVLITIPQLVHAEGEPWQRFSGIRFSGGKIGFVAEVGDAATDPSQGPFFYELDPVTSKTKVLKQEEYRKRFGEWTKPVTNHKYGENATLIVTEKNENLTIDYQECEQGEEGGPICKKQFITSGAVRLPIDSSRLCNIGCIVPKAEKYDDLLVLGLALEGEYGWYGYGFQIYSLKTKKLLLESDSKTAVGLLVSEIRMNPEKSALWIASNLGLHRIALRDKKVTDYFLSEGFDSASGEAQFLVGSTRGENDPFAVLARRLGVTQPKAFFTAVKALPPGSADLMRRLGWEELLPPSFNSLVPFLLPALSAPEDRVAIRAFLSLCKFDDSRVVDAVVKRYLTKKGDGTSRYLIENCFNRYAKRSRITGASAAALKAGLLNQIDSELRLIRSEPQWGPGSPRPDYRLIIQNIKGLKGLGDDSGFKTVNTFFAESAFPDGERSLFDEIAAEFLSDDEIRPTIIEALKRIPPHSLTRACQYFDMRWRSRAGRYSAEYAVAIAKAVHRFRTAVPSAPLSDGRIGTCVAAFKSQLKGDGVEAAFQSASSALSAEEKATANQIRAVEIKAD